MKFVFPNPRRPRCPPPPCGGRETQFIQKAEKAEKTKKSEEKKQKEAEKK